MKNVKFNLNDYIYVKLTEIGVEHYIDYLKNYTNEYEEFLTKNKDSENYTKIQAWEFIKIFGNRTGIELDECFEMNIIVKCKTLNDENKF